MSTDDDDIDPDFRVYLRRVQVPLTEKQLAAVRTNFAYPWGQQVGSIRPGGRIHIDPPIRNRNRMLVAMRLARSLAQSGSRRLRSDPWPRTTRLRSYGYLKRARVKLGWRLKDLGLGAPRFGPIGPGDLAYLRSLSTTPTPDDGRWWNMNAPLGYLERLGLVSSSWPHGGAGSRHVHLTPNGVRAVELYDAGALSPFTLEA